MYIVSNSLMNEKIVHYRICYIHTYGIACLTVKLIIRVTRMKDPTKISFGPSL